jgi:xylulokinase
MVHMSELLLGVDVGTYSTKGVLVTPGGEVVANVTEPHTVDFPRPGWAEQDADKVWWTGVCTVVQRLLYDRDASAVAALGVSAIGPCMVALDAAGEPVRPGILYGVDTRAERQIREIEGRIGRDEIVAWSRMELSSQAVGPKIAWFRQNEPELWERTTRIGTATSHLIARLTGRFVIDHHQAAHYIPLYDPRARVWSDRYAEDICPPEMLPELGWSDEIAGEVTAAAAAATGLPEGTPVVVGAVDALAEAVSVGAVSPGDLMIMYGSTAFLILTTSDPVTQPPMWSLPGAFSGSEVIAAGMATTGSLTRWLVDLCRPDNVDEAYETLFNEAAAIPTGSQGVLILPYFSGERTPVNDPGARGVIAGLSLSHHRGHLFRAALESVGYGIRHNLESMDPDGDRVRRCIAVGGGTRGDLWLRIVSDITGRAQDVPALTIGASYGDAHLGGRGVGILTPTDLASWVRHDRSIDPNPATAELHADRYRAYLDLYTATRPVIKQLSETPPATMQR